MAKFNDGINGPFKGKVGTVVGVTWKGIHCMRSLPKERTSAPTKAQQANRKKWTLSQSWLQPITEFVRIGWKGYSQKSERFIAAKSHLMKNAFEEVYAAFISYDRTRQSDSIYLGSVVK